MRSSVLFGAILALSSPALSEPAIKPIRAEPTSKLLPRQLDIDPQLLCETCTECFGEGNVICSYVGCYNPDNHEQCCADGAICIGKDNDCCRFFGGPGVSGTADGTPLPTESYTPSYTPSAPPTSFECRRGETGEECCSKGTHGLTFCGGSFPDYVCYIPGDQLCCENNVACYGEGCCEVIGSRLKEGKPTLDPNGPTATATAQEEETATSGAGSTGPTSTAGPTSSNVAAVPVKDVLGGGIAAGMVGLAAWL